MSNIIANTYIRVRRVARDFLLRRRYSASTINNLVKLDIFFRKLGIINSLKVGHFIFRENTFFYGQKDSGTAECILTNNSYEEEVTSEIDDILNSGDIFLDGGANIGFHTVIGSKIVGPSGKVFAFEPTPSTRTFLIRNVKINSLSNVSVEGYAISDMIGKVNFQVTDYSECNSVFENAQIVNGLIEVDKISIDEYCALKGILKIDLIKLDIEGQELKAMSGMKLASVRNPNLKMIFEYHAENLLKNNQNATILFRELGALGFCNFKILLKKPIYFSVGEDLSFLDELAKRHNLNILATKL
jgi:FkbM family methyltransferase